MKYIYDTYSKRIIGIELKQKHSYGSLYNFGVYLPSEESIENYKLELNTLNTYYSNYGNVIINGDLNVVL